MSSTDKHFSTSVSGSQSNGGARPPRHWTVDLASLATGRKARPNRPGFAARPTLGKNLIQAIKSIAATRRLSDGSIKLCVTQTIKLLQYLDRFENDNLNFKILNATDIIGLPWAGFQQWLSVHGNPKTRGTIYWQCKRILEFAIYDQTGDFPSKYTFPSNPFNKAGLVLDWDRTDELNEQESRRIASALVGQLTLTSSRLSETSDPESDFKRLKRIIADILEDSSEILNVFIYNSRDNIRPTAKDDLAHCVFANLCKLGELPKSVAVVDNLLRPLDRYAHDLRFKDIGVTSISTDIILTNVGIEQRKLILEAVIAGPQRVSLELSRSLGLSFNQLTSLCNSLDKEDSLNQFDRGRGKRYIHQNVNTLEDLDFYRWSADATKCKVLGTEAQLAVLRPLLPTETELRIAFAMLLLRTGWNTSTLAQLDVFNWNKPHNLQGKGGNYVSIFSTKERSGGRFQYTESYTNRPFSTYDILSKVIEWTSPLRAALCYRIKKLESDINYAESSKKQKIRNELHDLRYLKSSPWIYLGSKGDICRLELRWSDVNELFKRLGVTRDDGSAISFSQTLSRRTWAKFNFEKSESSAILTRDALGHSDLGSLMHYIAGRKELDKQTQRWLKLQTALLDIFQQNGSANPNVIRHLVNDGLLTQSEIEAVEQAGSVSTSGFVCTDPFNPDKRIDPGHRPGRICQTQNCLQGCSKAFVTFDTAIHLAREINRLKKLQCNLPIPVWQASDYATQLQTAETLFSNYSELNQKLALSRASRSPIQTFFGTMNSVPDLPDWMSGL